MQERRDEYFITCYTYHFYFMFTLNFNEKRVVEGKISLPT